MPKRKIKVVRCAKCGKRYGSMKEGQKCPHCARARAAKGTKQRKNPAIRKVLSSSGNYYLVEGISRSFGTKHAAVSAAKRLGKGTPMSAIPHTPTPVELRKAHLAHARAVRKARNPRGVHLPGLGVKYQRMYKKILRSPGAKRRYGVRLKEVAARTVRKFARSNNPADLGALADVVVGLAGLKYLAAKDTKRNPKHKRIARRMGSQHYLHRIRQVRPKNPSGQHLWKKFHGVPSRKNETVRASKRFPSKGSWVLGPINYLKVRKGRKVQTIHFAARRAKLIGNGKRLFAIANAQFKQLRGVNPAEHGLVPVEVGYEKIAPHLSEGYMGLTPWHHKFGDKNGRMPKMFIDHEGFAIIGGGNVHVKADGIHD